MSSKDDVLKILQSSKNEYISGEQLSGRLEVSRAAIWKCVNSLRREGYCIDAVTNRGYSLRDNKKAAAGRTIATGSGLTLEMLQLTMEKTTAKLFVYDEIDSTNLQAKRLIIEGQAGHGSVAFANRQTAGRGRLGRMFHSPKDGIYLSIVIRPDFDMSRSVLVTVAAATAVAEAIDRVCGLGLQNENQVVEKDGARAGDLCGDRKAKVETQIKWVNDIFLDGRKVCGILTEATTDFESGAIDNLIIGIGVNTSMKGFPKDLRDVAGAIPLSDAKAKSELVARIVEKTLDYVGEICDGKTHKIGDGKTDRTGREKTDRIGGRKVPGFMEKYRQKSMLIGKEILVFKGVYREDPRSEIDGVRARATGIDDAGGLRVKYEDGKRETLATGEVSVRL
ncbi:MAG: HTH domain-containing protein [Eubacteriales bacterium]|nr:HTH domain-containing protein [Eubacteriales bacterium]